MELRYFWKHDCAPCAEKKPVAEAIASAAGLPLVYVDTEENSNESIVTQCKVRAVPTLCVVEGGKRLFGFYGKMIEPEKILRLLGK